MSICTVRYIKYRMVGFFSEDISMEKMFSHRTGAAHKYTKTDDSKLCNTNILQMQKESSSPCANRQLSSISLTSKNEEGQETYSWFFFFSQSDQRTLNIKTDKASRDTKNSSCKWISNKLMFQELIKTSGPLGVDLFASTLSSDFKVYNLVTRSTCMDGGCISNELDKPKSI